MFNQAFRTVLYEIAIRTLPLVALETNPNIVGILLQTVPAIRSV